MTTRTLTGYIARETEKAVAFVAAPLTVDVKPLWVPISKIEKRDETDEYSPTVQLAGEAVRRLCIPVSLDVDADFLDKVGA